MDQETVRIFTAVVDTGSFTAAGRLLRMPKSTVSRRIAELESTLGVELLRRTTRTSSLTEAGRRFYDHAARAVAEIEAGKRAVAMLDGRPRGQLRVTAPLDLSFLGPACGEFMRQHPEVELELVCTDRRVDIVQEGFDVALRAGPLLDSTLVQRRVTSWKGIVVASPQYLRRRGTPKRPEDLATHDTILFGAGTARRHWTLVRDDETVEVPLVGRVVTNDLQVVEDSLLAGIGLALWPDFRSRQLIDAGRLRPVLKAWCAPEIVLHALYSGGRWVSPAVQGFVDVLIEHVAR